jgi:hypothetical protein
MCDRHGCKVDCNDNDTSPLMSQSAEATDLSAVHKAQEDVPTVHPPSPSPSEPEEFALRSSASRTPSQRPTEQVSTSPSTSSPAPTLANNPDYIALQSSLTLLDAQHRQAIEDMRTLVALKERALANPSWFKQLVFTGELGKMVPKKQNVVRCPRVDWEKYGSLGTRLGRELDKPTPVEPLYTVCLFPDVSVDARVCSYFPLWSIKRRDQQCRVIGYIRVQS